MAKQIQNFDRGRSFAEGDYLIHVSGMIGKATGEVVYEPRNPIEKTRIILRNGFPLVDYSLKFCVASESEVEQHYWRTASIQFRRVLVYISDISAGGNWFWRRLDAGNFSIPCKSKCILASCTKYVFVFPPNPVISRWHLWCYFNTQYSIFVKTKTFMKAKILFLALLTFPTWAIAGGDNGGGGASGGAGSSGKTASAPPSQNGNNPNNLQNPASPYYYTNNPSGTNYPSRPNYPTNNWVNPTNSFFPTNPAPAGTSKTNYLKNPAYPNHPFGTNNPNNPNNTYTRDNPNNPNNPYTRNNPNNPNNPYTRNNPNNFTNNEELGMTNELPYYNFTNRAYGKPYTVDPRTMGNGNAETNH